MSAQRIVSSFFVLGLTCTMCTSCDVGSPRVVALIRVERLEMPKERYDIYKATQKALIESPYVMSAALRRMGLKSCETLKSKRAPLEWLGNKVRIAFPGGSEIMEVSLSGVPKDDAMMIVNAVVDAYLEEVSSAERNEVSQRLEILRGQYRKDIRTLQDANASIEKLSAQVGDGSSLVDVKRELKIESVKALMRRIEKLEMELVMANVDANALAELDSAAASKAEKRASVLAKAISGEKTKYEEEAEELMDMHGFSADLDSKRARFESLREATQQVFREIHRLELSIKEPPRVKLIQRAILDKL